MKKYLTILYKSIWFNNRKALKKNTYKFMFGLFKLQPKQINKIDSRASSTPSIRKPWARGSASPRTPPSTRTSTWCSTTPAEASRKNDEKFFENVFLVKLTEKKNKMSVIWVKKRKLFRLLCLYYIWSQFSAIFTYFLRKSGVFLKTFFKQWMHTYFLQNSAVFCVKNGNFSPPLSANKHTKDHM
jgi:hypothetical protein